MKRMIVIALAAAVADPSAAQQTQQAPTTAPPKPKAEIIAYDADGKPDRVRVDGYEYKLCKGGQTDSCINPQDAGFDWGGRELTYWPGRPASEIEGPLPEHKPEEPKDDDKTE
jgi:hypothetical protein